jgi:hypothetical protein
LKSKISYSLKNRLYLFVTINTKGHRMDSNRIVVGVILLGASLVVADMLIRECTQKERIVVGVLVGAANGAFIGGGVPVPGGAVAGAAVGAALGGLAGKNYDDFHKDSRKEDRHNH